MKKADVEFLCARLLDEVRPAFKNAPGDDTAVAFAEMQCVLCGMAIARMLEESTPEGRADFVRRWLDAAAGRRKAEIKPPPCRSRPAINLPSDAVEADPDEEPATPPPPADFSEPAPASKAARTVVRKAGGRGRASCKAKRRAKG